MATFTFDVETADLSVKPRVRAAAFGDGYEQRVGDGINNAPRIWALTFTRPTVEADEILAFFEARNGVEAFDWAPPYGAAGRFVVREWKSRMISDVAKSISATFEQVFGA